jgi:peptidoglycan hydrolase-like amidase
MSRGIAAVLAAGAFAVLGTVLVGGPPPQAYAASCTAWTSHVKPPPTIRVYRTETGEVETVRFRRYTKNVLSREWISTWTRRSLRAGALIVRNYAWYQVLNWRGGENEDGECYDVRDDVRDQVYDPDRPIYRTVGVAVDSIWKRLLLKGGAIFPTYYNAGVPGEDCGANADGRRAYQWGTQTCGLDGISAARILKTYYYPRVRVTGAPAPSPPASQSPTPSSTPTPTPDPSVEPSSPAP